MAVIDNGNSSSGKANVNTAYALSVAPDLSGSGVRCFSENDSGTLTGSALNKSAEVSADYRLRTGRDTVLFTDSFNATTQNTNNWNYISATLTAAQAGVGSINFSAVQGTTSSHGASIRTSQYFPLIGTSALSGEFTFGQFNAVMVTDENWLMGFGLPQSAILRPLDGVWVKLTIAGLEGIICFNNQEYSTGVIRPFSAFVLGDVDKVVIVVGEREVQYWMDDVLLFVQTIPVANGQRFLAKTAPLFMMKYNSGNVSNTNTMRVMDTTVTLYDIDYLMPAPHVAAFAGAHISVGQNGQTQGMTAGNFQNAAVPTTAAGSNTALTANLPAGIGGYGVMTAQATATGASHDMVATSFLNPVPTANITGRTIMITGVWISCMNTGAAVLIWGLAYGSLNASLATTETASFATATTRAPRKIPLGCMTVAVGAAVGATYDRDIYRQFASPIAVRPGEYIQTTVHFRVGTATASQEVTYVVGFDGYWV